MSAERGVNETVYHPARLVARRDAGGGMIQVTVEVTPDVAATHTSPGQYVEVRVGGTAEGRTGFFVLANAPGTPDLRRWDFVMRAGGNAADVLLTMTPGAELELTAAIGAGFPMADARGRPLVVAVSGTGIAAGRPIVERRIAEGDAANTRVFMGIRTRAELPMRGDIEAWMGAGVEVLVCLSKDEGSIEGVPHAHGYVQNVLRRVESRDARSDPDREGRWSRARIFAVGNASMIEGLKAVAPELGISPEDVHTNHREV
jgi:NAD(P)H-flavin reductase